MSQFTEWPAYYATVSVSIYTASDASCVSRAHFILHTNSKCKKREAHISWSIVKKAAPVTGITTTGPVPADCRQ